MFRLVFALFLSISAAHAATLDPRNFDDIMGAMGNQIPFPPDALQNALLGLDSRSDIFQTSFPHGRSLERRFTDFSEPRSVMGWQNDRFALDPYLLFIAYTPRLEQLEVISWNWNTRRFDFEIVGDYASGKTPKLVPIPRALCTACHQNQGPVYPSSPWQETTENLDILNQLRKTPDLEPFARSVIANNGRPGKIVTDPGQLDLRVRTADEMTQDQRICADACGRDLECRKNLFLAGVLGFVDVSEQFNDFGNNAAFASLLSRNWPADDFAMPTSLIAGRELRSDPLEFNFEQDPLMKRFPQMDQSPDNNALPGGLTRFSRCLDLTKEEVAQLKHWGSRKLMAVMGTRQIAEVAAETYPQGSEIVAAFSSAIANPQPDDSTEVVQLPPPAHLLPVPFGKNPTSPQLFRHYCSSCHEGVGSVGGSAPRAPALPLGDLTALHTYVGSAGRTVQNLIDPENPLMPPLGAPQPTSKEREKMLHDLIDAKRRIRASE